MSQALSPVAARLHSPLGRTPPTKSADVPSVTERTQKLCDCCEPLLRVEQLIDDGDGAPTLRMSIDEGCRARMRHDEVVSFTPSGDDVERPTS